MLKDKMKVLVKELENEFFNYVKDIYEHPEIGNLEFRTSKLEANILEKYGFEVIYPYYLETAFKGIYQAKKEGPTIAFLCEYDALPEVGHGCGHNLIGITSILAATLLKSVIDEIGGKIYVFGCPAEENFGGKVKLANEGCFDDCDVALMLHPSDKNGLGGRSLSIIPYKFEFYGKSAHGCRPYNGHSALDGVVLLYQSISMLRQFIKPGSFIHGIIKDGGKAANVIPEYASMEYYFRAPTYDYCNYIKDEALLRAHNIAKMCHLEIKETIYEEIYKDKKINYTLAKALKKAFNDCDIFDVCEVNETPNGSTDVGAVSYKCPTIEGNIKICDSNINGHSKEFALKTISCEGRIALTKGALVLANLAYDLICDKELLLKVKEEFLNA